MQLNLAHPSALTERKGLSPIVQRKIGLEFQAYDSVTIKPIKPGSLKDKVFGKSTGFTIEKDQGAGIGFELEIVTSAVEETDDGRDKLEKLMDQIEVITSKIKHEMLLSEAFEGQDIEWVKKPENFQFIVNESVHFHPQATVGVKYEKISDLIDVLTSANFMTGGEVVNVDGTSHTTEQIDESFLDQINEIGWSGMHNQRPFKGAWKTGLCKAKTFMKGQSNKAVSFVAILYCLAEVSQSKIITIKENQSLFKYFMPLCFRMGLRPFYKSLTANERNLIHILIPDDVLGAQVMPKGDNAQVKLSIRELLELLRNGKDLQDKVPGLPGYGQTQRIKEFGLSNMSDIGSSDRDGALIELRKLGNDVPPNKLKTFALAVFDLVKAINSDT